MVGRKFNWYKLNGSVKSKIDKILVSREWLEVWSNNKQFVLSRSVSDHCALVLKDTCVDWGLKPFRRLDVWQNNCRLQGGGLFILKEKLKMLKSDLKAWNRDVFRNVNQISMLTILCYFFVKLAIKVCLT